MWPHHEDHSFFFLLCGHAFAEVQIGMPNLGMYHRLFTSSSCRTVCPLHELCMAGCFISWWRTEQATKWGWMRASNLISKNGEKKSQLHPTRLKQRVSVPHSSGRLSGLETLTHRSQHTRKQSGEKHKRNTPTRATTQKLIRVKPPEIETSRPRETWVSAQAIQDAGETINKSN